MTDLVVLGTIIVSGLLYLIKTSFKGVSFLRGFKIYRKFKGGKWWKVKKYLSVSDEYLWMSSHDHHNFPEFDRGFMENSGSFYVGGRGYSYYGWEGMENKPTEVYTK